MAGHSGSRAEIAGIEHKPLTTEQLAAASLDPCIFIDRHCYIRGKGGRQERFRITGKWGFQSEVVQCFDEEDLTLVLKARQLGISWSADAYALWLTSCNQGQTVIILSQGQRESKEEMRRIRYMHKRLPPELKRRTGVEAQDSHAPDTTEHLEFPDMDSRIISLPSTEHAGTSYTATLVIIHELAKITMAASLVAAITPTMADSGRMIIVSTALGFSGTFYDYWQNNADRWHTGQIVGDRGIEGTFRPVFIPWSARPGRTQAWYEATKRNLGEKKMKQEYPATPTEAFQGAAEQVFDEFDRYSHVLDASRHPGSNYEVIGCCDMGVSHAYGHLIEVQGPMAFIFDEVHVENGTVEDLGTAMADLMRHHGLDPSEIMVYPDPAGVARNPQTLQTDIDVLKECGLLVDDSSNKVSPAQRVEIIKNKLKRNHFWLSQDCPGLADALEKAEWKTRAGPGGTKIREDTYAKDGLHEHPLDSAGYGLSRIYPPNTAVAIETEVAVATPVGSYSGSEYGG